MLHKNVEERKEEEKMPQGMGQDASSPPRFVEELDESVKKEKRQHRGGQEQLKATGKRSRRYTWWNGNDDDSPGKINNKEDDDLMLMLKEKVDPLLHQFDARGFLVHGNQITSLPKKINTLSSHAN